MVVFFNRAEKENSGQFAKYKGVYCPVVCDITKAYGLDNPGQLSLHLAITWLIWFQDETIHAVRVGKGFEIVGTMKFAKNISFSDSKPPFKGVKNIPGFTISWNPPTKPSSEIWAFNDTHMFAGEKDSFHFLVKESPIAARVTYLNNMLPKIADDLGHRQMVTSSVTP
ncbi:hypothetical protein AB8Z38_04570 [Bradyrhizobium sp. LLZ17]|uniref:Uncharacterized protein n=1 Tax=Bradyrhizobium sp. LLZ17 TaxID=3239388 RepID=A0AB39XMT5_9BRAD